MKILIITDIHANQVALETVLEEADGYEAVWCLGDVVGYGPNPNECVDIVKDLPGIICLTGNHDAAAINRMDISTFNPEARQSIEWTQKELTPESISFLEDRPETMVIDHITLAHGSPRQPVYEYLLDTRAATENFEYFENDFCFVGHTHLPVIFHLKKGELMSGLMIPQVNGSTPLAPRAILNPGSVGQPRDRDPRAAYVIFDPDANTWEYRRIEYDIVETQKRMETHNLPERHVVRLESGW